MSAGCVRWVLSRTARTVCGNIPGQWTLTPRCMERSNSLASSLRWAPFSTAEETPPALKKKKHSPQAPTTVSTVGRKIPHRLINVISDTGEDMGTMHRADVIKIMDVKGLKLIVLNEHKDPPLYQLLSGKQVHEEQLKMREKQKSKAAPVQVKELTFSSGIASHDLGTKLKQVESWLEKKHHVKVTVRSARGDSNASPDKTLEQIVQQVGVPVGFSAKPHLIREGRAAACILRPPSAKELAQGAKNKEAAQPGDQAAQSKAASDTDTTQEALPQ